VGSFKNSIGVGNYNKKFASTTKNHHVVKSPIGGHRSMQDRYTIRNDRPKKLSHQPEHEPPETAGFIGDSDSLS